jgi:hypothetical protein
VLVQIAFFEGSAREQSIIVRLFERLFKHTAFVNKLHGLVGSEALFVPIA